ncbi:MAG: choice-of-anchor M domain-containing protein [Acidimicrobiia bacterium]|nr:choice-of-anchor M domain-containing protein [Acidimicrobiia bacterium]
MLAGAGALLLSATPALAHGDHDHDHGDRVVLSQGHVDLFDVHYHDGALELEVHDETVHPAVHREPDEVLVHVKPEAAMAVPANPSYSFLGEAGSTVWVLPQQQDPHLLWPGWSTDELDAGVFEDDQVHIDLLEVHGDSDFWLYTVDGFGEPTVLFDSGDLPGTITVPVGVHAHGNWAFNAEGDVDLVVEARATLSGGGEISTGPVEYEFFVGPMEHGPGFPDVPPGHPFYDEIDWLVDAGITTGYDDGTFRPTWSVTRQAMAAFLYRLHDLDDHGHDHDHNGHGHGHSARHGDDPHCHGDPFPDVPESHPFCGEIDWLVDAGITTGYNDGTFRPTEPVTRQAMAAFLYRMHTLDDHDHDHNGHDHDHHGHGHSARHGDDPHCHGDPFPDVPESHPFCGEIDWLVDAGITTGYNDGTFRPTDLVSRQAMAAFLYRLHHLHSDVQITIEGMGHHYHTDDVVTLTAVMSDTTGVDHYHWFVSCPVHGHDHDHDQNGHSVRHGGHDHEYGDFVVIPGEGDAIYSFVATPELDGCRYKVTAYGGGHSVIATSDYVTLDVDDHDDHGHDH